MPKGIPTAAQLWQGEISFFSIDTDLIQQAGFNFDKGALNQLPVQLPTSMELLLSEVVVEEIVRHRMEPVLKAVQQITGGSDDLKRLANIALGPIDDSFKALNTIDVATDLFRNQVHAYAARCGGSVIAIAGTEIAPKVFKLYFENAPPFGNRKDKKSEFPDATSLLLLEQHAFDNNTIGIIASGDEGWSAFADQSEYLFAVKSIEALAELFAATSEHANALKAKILAAVNDDSSPLRAQLTEALQHHIEESNWDADEFYASSGRVEAEVYDVEMTDYTLTEEDISVWPVEGEPTKWVVELTALVEANVPVSVEFFIWDSIDREELSIGSESVSNSMEIEVEAYLSCSEVHLETGPNDWDIDVEIAKGNYSVEGFEVERDFGDRE